MPPRAIKSQVQAGPLPAQDSTHRFRHLRGRCSSGTDLIMPCRKRLLIHLRAKKTLNTKRLLSGIKLYKTCLNLSTSRYFSLILSHLAFKRIGVLLNLSSFRYFLFFLILNFVKPLYKIFPHAGNVVRRPSVPRYQHVFFAVTLQFISLTLIKVIQRLMSSATLNLVTVLIIYIKVRWNNFHAVITSI